MQHVVGFSCDGRSGGGGEGGGEEECRFADEGLGFNVCVPLCAQILNIALRVVCGA